MMMVVSIADENKVQEREDGTARLVCLRLTIRCLAFTFLKIHERLSANNAGNPASALPP
jgi:hypothetical protein